MHSMCVVCCLPVVLCFALDSALLSTLPPPPQSTQPPSPLCLRDFSRSQYSMQQISSLQLYVSSQGPHMAPMHHSMGIESPSPLLEVLPSQHDGHSCTTERSTSWPFPPKLGIPEHMELEQGIRTSRCGVLPSSSLTSVGNHRRKKLRLEALLSATDTNTWQCPLLDTNVSCTIRMRPAIDRYLKVVM
jgi:hypothetical protein